MTRKFSPRYWIWGLAVVGLLGLGGLGIHFERVSRLDQEALSPPPGPAWLDRQGRLLRLGADARGRRVLSLPPGPLPELVVAAFLAAEDARFWEHNGIDVRALGRAALSNLQARRVVSGASTITMQLARLAHPAPRTWYHKLLEMLRSRRLEAAWSKDDILRAYLDQAPLGNNLVGVETAARIYFDKPAAQATPGEAALLAALVQAPGRLNPLGPNRQRLLSRRNWVLERMAQLGHISPEASRAASQTGLALRPGALFPFEAAHFVDLVQAEAGSGGVRLTTLDLPRQRRAQAIVRSHHNRLQPGGVSQAAAVIIHNPTMEVLALVGSYEYGPQDQGFNNGAAAKRSPGSTLKPFLYAQALDRGFSPALMLEDVEGRYRTPRGEFVPANFDRVAHGPIAMREALGNSLNLAAVSLLNQVGQPVFYDLLTRLQLINHPERAAEHYGLGLVVGNPEVSLLQLAAAFACLANGGTYRPAILCKGDAGKVKPEQIFSPQAAYIINDILADPLARSRTFAASMAMNPPFRLAIKTGTSTRYRDGWAVGYSPEYTIAVWTGNFDGRPTAKMSGAVAAAPILEDLAAAVLSPGRGAEFAPPPGVVSHEVCSFSGMRPGPDCRHRRQELFMAGAEPGAQCSYHQDREPWHHMPTGFAGWLHHRFTQQGAGRFRLAGFDADLARTFGEPESPVGTGQKVPWRRSPSAPPSSELSAQPRTSRPANLNRGSSPILLGDNLTVHLHATLFPALAAGKAPQVSITSPLPGDRFLTAPGQEAVTLALKASCRTPFPQVVWFVDGREYAAVRPPYETTLLLGRGRHRLTVLSPDGLADSLEVWVE